jgi:hypothetical protein
MVEEFLRKAGFIVSWFEERIGVREIKNWAEWEKAEVGEQIWLTGRIKAREELSEGAVASVDIEFDGYIIPVKLGGGGASMIDSPAPTFSPEAWNLVEGEWLQILATIQMIGTTKGLSGTLKNIRFFTKGT